MDRLGTLAEVEKTLGVRSFYTDILLKKVPINNLKGED